MPALVHFPRDCCTANVIILLQHDNIQPGFCQVGSVGQAIVTCADDDRVVCIQCLNPPYFTSILDDGAGQIPTGEMCGFGSSQDFLRRVVARVTGQIAARMTAGTAKIQAGYGCAVLCCFIGRAHH